MPDASGFLTNRDAARIKRMAHSGSRIEDIAEMIGCRHSSVSRYAGGYFSSRERAERYERFVALASAYVPTFGGGR